MKIDLPKALTLFKDSALKGYSQAAFNMGVMNANGEGTKPNDLEAYAWFSVAKTLGDPNAGSIVAPVTARMTPEQKKAADDRATEILGVIHGTANPSK